MNTARTWPNGLPTVVYDVRAVFGAIPAAFQRLNHPSISDLMCARVCRARARGAVPLCLWWPAAAQPSAAPTPQPTSGITDVYSVYMNIYDRLYMNMYMHMYMCMYTWMWMYMSMYMYM